MFELWFYFVSMRLHLGDFYSSLVRTLQSRSGLKEGTRAVLSHSWIVSTDETRKINSPYKGTLSSYGYVLLVIYFLVHVKSPPVLPNLQQMPPLRPISQADTHIGGNNVW